LRALVVISFLLLAAHLCAQPVTATADSLKQKTDLLMAQADSIRYGYSARDSVMQIAARRDSLVRHYQHKRDSIDKATLGKVDSSVARLNHAIDSLNKLPSMTVALYQQKVDSLYKHLQNKVRTLYTASTDSVSGNVKSKMTSLEAEFDKRTHFLDSLTKHTDATANHTMSDKLNFTLPGAETSLDKLPDIPGSDLSIDKLDLPAVEKPSLPAMDIAKPSVELPAVGSIGEVGEKVGKVGEIATEASEYAEDLKNIKENGIKESEKIPELAEQKLMEMDQLKSVQGELAKAELQKNSMLETMTPPKSPEEIQRKAWEAARQKAIDHFNGKEEVLQKALDQVSEYKRKYETVSAVTNLKKRPDNPLKSKSFIERIRPGVYFQYQRKGYHSLDVNPYAGYWILPWLTAGGGWNQRIVYEPEKVLDYHKTRIYGPRIYTDVHMGRGFIVHVESESQNTFVQTDRLNDPEKGQREWVWGMQMGLKKEFGIYKGCKGIVLIQYNMFDRLHKAPYSDRLNSRLGFEWQLHKKAEKDKKPNNKNLLD
jgi:hypothetical protein